MSEYTAPAPGCVLEPLDLVLFSAGGWRVGIEARRVCGAHPAPHGESVTEVAALLGLAHLAPLVPLAPLEPLEPMRPVAAADTTPGARQCLSLKHAAGVREIHVEAPVELVGLSAAAIHPLPPLLAARTHLPGLCALVFPPAADACVLLFDATVLGADA